MMYTISDDDEKTLEALNKAVDDAAQARKKWLDENMERYSDFKIGDEVFDMDTLSFAGIVTELYRLMRTI